MRLRPMIWSVGMKPVCADVAAPNHASPRMDLKSEENPDDTGTDSENAEPSRNPCMLQRPSLNSDMTPFREVEERFRCTSSPSYSVVAPSVSPFSYSMAAKP